MYNAASFSYIWMGIYLDMYWYKLHPTHLVVLSHTIMLLLCVSFSKTLTAHILQDIWQIIGKRIELFSPAKSCDTWIINQPVSQRTKSEEFLYINCKSVFILIALLCWNFCLLSATDSSHIPASCSCLGALLFPVFRSLICLYICLHLLFPLPWFDMTSAYRIVVSVLPFKQWCQARGMFCFSFAQKQLN